MASDVPAVVCGDPKRLQQSLANLLNDAIKFTSAGRVSLLVSREGTGADEWLVLEVTDTGIGIDVPKIKQVFEAFTQADASLIRQYGGTGLGLSITRALVQLMGGTVDAENAAGRGSIFVRACLCCALRCQPPTRQALSPLKARVAEASAQEDAYAPAHLGQSVLLAEDNEVNVYLAKAMLEGQGLQIDVANNGLTALDLAHSRRFAMIFMDVQMPGVNGLSVTRELRRFEAESGRSRIPIIALTANAYDADIESSIAAGCDLHIGKPFTKPQLVEALFRFVPVA